VRRDDRPVLEALPMQPLLQETTAFTDAARLAPALRAELEQLAAATDSLADRSERFWGLLRKQLGQPLLPDLLRGIVVLARAGQPAGARLLAALLDVHAPGAELVARIHRFDSSRRLGALLARGAGTEPRHAWLRRLGDTVALCQGRAPELPAAPSRSNRPADAEPFPLLRRWLEHLLATLVRHGDLGDEDKELLVALARLEVDAYEERVGRAASEVNPYLASAVSRLLPLLSQADGEIRAMREFIASLEAGRAGVAFRRRRPRLSEALAPGEREQLLRALEGQPDLAELGGLLRGVERTAIPMRRLAGAAARMMALAGLLREHGLRRTDLDLVSALATVQRFEQDGEMRLPVGSDLAATVAELLARRMSRQAPAEEAVALPAGLGEPTPAAALPLGEGGAAAAFIAEARGAPTAGPDEGPSAGSSRLAGWPLDGFRLEEDLLILRVPLEGRADRIWRDDLPATEAASLTAEAEGKELDTAALKRLVLANLDNVSVTLGFLRNAKVTAIPGLVATIVARCRSSRVLELIATDRSLYTGYANKDVPRALIASPCNIPVKTLTKFVHVKYVNKIDLQRMAKDKTGIRREVIKEIQDYLDTLGGS